MKNFNIKRTSFEKGLRSLLAILPILMILFTFASCDKELDVKTDFPFKLQVMPVPKNIAKGETVTIRCNIKVEGHYENTKYYIRYFQFDGSGKLSIGNGKAVTLKPNDLYIIKEQEFRLFYVSESNVSHNFDIWVSNDKGYEQKVSFQFNATDK
ncbi:DUF3872 domain-containing protein [Chryseobacterium sp. ISL-6]|uniref:DUF3872 domain-containing protein n=1 Tax=Chryseobacterium sp. ISL-6 TaxID=2819143 RepID=UPI001BE75F71|nr:DUF3872 domain-containing protein [Chryseobacterium sp. ISL-6]MBT2621897.1 DUF3872 domain-containing protein [Chryseobacterium sp. ISL-6]